MLKASIEEQMNSSEVVQEKPIKQPFNSRKKSRDTNATDSGCQSVGSKQI